MWALGTVVLVWRRCDRPLRLSSPCSRCDSSVWVTWLTNTGTLSSVWHSTVRSNEEEADLPTTRWLRAGLGGEQGDALMLLDEQERVLNFLKAALKEDSDAWSFLSSLFESDLFGAGEGMSRSDSKLRLYSFFFPNLLLLFSLDLRIPRKPTGGSGGETRGVSGEAETGDTEETLEQGEDISLAD